MTCIGSFHRALTTSYPGPVFAFVPWVLFDNTEGREFLNAKRSPGYEVDRQPSRRQGRANFNFFACETSVLTLRNPYFLICWLQTVAVGLCKQTVVNLTGIFCGIFFKTWWHYHQLFWLCECFIYSTQSTIQIVSKQVGLEVFQVFKKWFATELAKRLKEHHFLKKQKTSTSASTYHTTAHQCINHKSSYNYSTMYIYYCNLEKRKCIQDSSDIKPDNMPMFNSSLVLFVLQLTPPFLFANSLVSMSRILSDNSSHNRSVN